MVTASSLRLSEGERELLRAGAATLGIALDAAMVANLDRFAEVLAVWSPRVNLISCGSARELVERHFLDSLALTPMLPETGPIVDLGTGAGFPGVPLAVVRPQQRLVLVEVRRRRVSFLREVKRTLQLSNVEILEQRAEVPPPEHEHQAEGVVSRAVWSETPLAAMASGWLRPRGRLFWMRSEPMPKAFSVANLVWEQAIRYRIGTGRLKTIEVLRFQPEGSGSECST